MPGCALHTLRSRLGLADAGYGGRHLIHLLHVLAEMLKRLLAVLLQLGILRVARLPRVFQHVFVVITDVAEKERSIELRAFQKVVAYQRPETSGF